MRACRNHEFEPPPVAVVIPCYKVRSHVLAVIARIGEEVQHIYVVDDACPEQTGSLVSEQCEDPRVEVIWHSHNLGVGGAVMSGYRAAIKEGCEVIVKLDGDGQMDAGLIKAFIAPVINGEADYTKGNRFFDLEKIRTMPTVRLLGNAALSLITKLSCGYWHLFDPTNGYTAIHSSVASRLPMDKISSRYFFETDMLFRLNTLRAVVLDIPMDAVYGDEKSNLRIAQVLPEFLFKHGRNLFKRIFYNYYLRDMSLASLELPLGLVLFVFGFVLGITVWIEAIHSQSSTPLGTIMLAVLPMLSGLQLLLAFLAYDIGNVPRQPLQKSICYQQDRKA